MYIANHRYKEFNLDVKKFAFVWIPAYRASSPDFPCDLWQYSDKGRVSGITGNVDVNRYQRGRMKEFFIGGSTAPPKDAYYKSNPGRIEAKTTVGLYGRKDVGFTGGHVGGTYKKGTRFKIKGIDKSKTGIPRLVTESGYLLTANKKYVGKV